MIFGKYKANTDFTPSVEAEEISLVYASGDFKGAIAKADENCKKDGDKADVKLYRTKAYAYDKLGDSVNALKNMEIFLAKQILMIFCRITILKWRNFCQIPG